MRFNDACCGSVAELRSIILKARRLADDHAGQERAVAAVKIWLLAQIEAFIAFSIGPIQTARYLSNQTSSSRKLLMMLLTIIVQFLT